MKLHLSFIPTTSVLRFQNRNSPSTTIRAVIAILYILAISVSSLTFPQPAKAESVVYEASTSASTNSATTLDINKPTGVIADDMLIAVIGVSQQSATITPPDGTWTSILKSTNGTSVTVESFWKRIDGSEGASFTFTVGTSGRIVGGISSYRGVDTSSTPTTGTPSTTTGSASSSLDTASITPGVSRAKIVQIYAMDDAAPRTFTPSTTPDVNERIDAATSDGVNNDVSIELTDFSQSTAAAFDPANATASGNGTWATHQLALSPNGTTNMMLFWDGTGSPPTGWSYVTEAEGRSIRGESPANYSGTGGSSTHTPTSTVTHSAPTGTPSATGGQSVAALVTHSHSASNTIGSASNERASRTLRLIRYNDGIPNFIPAGAITIFDSSPGIPATGWTSLSGAAQAFNGKFIKAGSTPNTDSGSDTHTHTLTWSALGASTGSQGRGPLLLNVQTAQNGHTHTAPTAGTTSTNGTSAADCDAAPVATTCLPSHVQVLLAKADADTNVLSIGITAMFDGAPGGGWVVRSDTGGPYNQRFIRGGATYSEGLGAATHDHANATSGASGADPQASAGTAESLLGGTLAQDNHTHTMTSDFAAVDHTPPYFNVVVAEKVNFIFNHYAWYDDPDTAANTVSSRYSGLDIAQDAHIVAIPAQNDPPYINRELRLRIQILVNNSNLAADEIEFKLQYREDNGTSLTSTTCIDGSWTDVGDNGGSEIWKFAASPTTDGGQLTGTTVFSPASSTMHRYVKSTTSGKNIGAVTSGQTMEWDYHIMHNGAVNAAQYRFRLVEDSGILLSQYGYGSPTVTPVCPTLTTRAGPAEQLRHGNFFDASGLEKGFSWSD